MMYRIIALVSLILLSFAPSNAQKLLKQEREERIKLKEMPEVARQYLNSYWLEQSRRKRFYYETDGENSSYEAKLIRDKRRFSIEFNKTGDLQDIEELINFDQIPDSTRLRVDSTIVANYGKYNIYRVQRQFLPKGLSEHYTNLTSESIQNFELEVNVVEDTRVQSYEMLFDAQGNLQQKRLIVRRSLDNFLY